MVCWHPTLVMKVPGSSPARYLEFFNFLKILWPIGREETYLDLLWPLPIPWGTFIIAYDNRDMGYMYAVST